MEKTKKLFSQKGIAIATFFGGPMAAGYLVKKNYDFFEQRDKGRIAFAIGIISTLTLILASVLTPEDALNKIPNTLIPFIYTGIIYIIVEKTQGEWLNKYEKSERVFYNGWRATGIGLLFMPILFLLIMATAFISESIITTDSDLLAYDNKLFEFSKNEEEALKAFDKLNTSTSTYLIHELNKGIKLWQENEELVSELNAIEDLSPELIEQNKRLLQYSKLRKLQYQIYIKDLEDSTNKYNKDIKSIEEEISKLLSDFN